MTNRMEIDLVSTIEEMGEMTGLFDEDEDSEILPDHYMPDEYVVLIQGFRGSGKTVLGSLIDINALEAEYPVFSNLHFYTDYLDKVGIKNHPKQLDMAMLFSFAEEIIGAVINIDEIDAQFDKLRTLANQNLIMTKVMEQLRKRGWKFIFTCQFGSYLPYGLNDQVDLLITAHDAFFSPWGREKNLGKGQLFIYSVIDKSGLFTGGRRAPIYFPLMKAERMWPFFNSYQTQNPFAFAQKYKIDAGDEKILSDGEVYSAEDFPAREHEKDMKGFQTTLTQIWNTNIMGFIYDNADKLGMSDLGNEIRVPIGAIEKAIEQIKGPSSKILQNGLDRLRMESQRGYVIKKHRGNSLIITKPQTFAAPGEEATMPELGENLHYEKVE